MHYFIRYANFNLLYLKNSVLTDSLINDPFYVVLHQMLAAACLHQLLLCPPDGTVPPPNKILLNPQHLLWFCRKKKNLELVTDPADIQIEQRFLSSIINRQEKLTSNCVHMEFVCSKSYNCMGMSCLYWILGRNRKGEGNRPFVENKLIW